MAIMETELDTMLELKNKIDTKTINLVLLVIATAGIYLILWLNDNYKIIDKITKTKTADDVYIIWIAVTLGLSGMFNVPGDQELLLISFMLTIAYLTLCVIWAFRAKKAFENYLLIKYKIDLKMNAFYTVIFNIYYINYCINDLPEIQKKQQILNN